MMNISLFRLVLKRCGFSVVNIYFGGIVVGLYCCWPVLLFFMGHLCINYKYCFLGYRTGISLVVDYV
jgi:hypothetical protein